MPGSGPAEFVSSTGQRTPPAALCNARVFCPRPHSLSSHVPHFFDEVTSDYRARLSAPDDRARLELEIPPLSRPLDQAFKPCAAPMAARRCFRGTVTSKAALGLQALERTG